MNIRLALKKIVWRLLNERQVSYRWIRLEMDLDDEKLEALRHELIVVRRWASDRDGEYLVWVGGGPAADTPSTASLLPPLNPPSAIKPTEPTSRVGQSAPANADTGAAPLSTEAERRPLTVMFCDLADSTELSTKLDPEDLQDVIRSYQETCTKLIQEYGGFVAKYMGDGILVYFGYPKSLERNAERAVRSGLAIIEAILALNRTMGRDKGIDIAVRIGVATGMVMVGEIVGEGMAQERTVIGEAPNMAARLQGVAERNGLVIGGLTRELTGDAFVYQDLGSHGLKGIAGQVQTWGVVGMVDDLVDDVDDDETDGAAEVPNLVGRDEETGLLRRAWASTREEGRGQVVTISGEAGIGKSVLIDGLKAEARQEGLERITFRCSPYHASSALYPMIGYLKRLAKWRPEDDSEAKLTKLEATLERYDQPLGESVPLIASVLSLQVPSDRYPAIEITPQQLKRQTQDTLIAILLETAEHQPLLTLWEDLHWADPSTLEFLGLLIEQAPTAALLVIATARPEFISPWPARSYITPITLNRLERPHAEALVTRIAGAKPLPEEVVDHIVTKTDGVPLYVEELTKTILESDILHDAGDHFELAGPLSSLSIPDTLQESLMARLDHLPQVRELAQIGSVLGREFAYEMISGLSNISDATLREGLGQLVESELLYQRGRPPHARYVFKHALVKDAAYGSLLRRPRQHYHQQVAELLETKFPDIVEAHPELLAHHYSEANVRDRAVDYWQTAGQRSIERSANAEAIAHLNFGISIIGAMPDDDASALRELKLQTMLAGPLIATKGYGAVETGAVFKRAQELSNRVEDPSLMFPVLYQQWVFNLIGSKIDEARDLAHRFLEMADAQDESLPKVLGHRITAVSHYFRGELGPARSEFETAIGLYDDEQHKDSTYQFGQNPKSASMAFQASTLHLMGYADQASALVKAAVDHSREINHANTMAYVLFYGAVMIAHTRRDLDAAVTSNTALLSLANEQGLALWKAVGTIQAGWIASLQGAHGDAIALAETGLEDLRVTGTSLHLPLAMAQMIEVHAANGQYVKALALLDEAMEHVDRTNERLFEAELYRLKGELLIFVRGLDDTTEAEKLFFKSLEIAQNQGAKSWELRTSTRLARLWAQKAKIGDARNLLQPIHDWFTEGFDTMDLIDAEALLNSLKQ
ncbi:MAG: AAA family ATPase [Rhodospirillaceae bacterium]|nr:AAA family ATPase [Rhodospirillaceae bacterium]MBT6139428.1 AAA family ATPase [Rhodospirillaceae bacterium]